MTTPTTAPALQLKISTDYTNSLDGITLYEPVNETAFQQLIRSDLLRDSFSCEFTNMRHDNELSMLREYHATRVEIDGAQYIPVVYKKTANNPFGRSNPVRALGLFNIRREIRQTLVIGRLVDIDIVNAHPVMLHQILLAAKVPHPCLANYVADRETYLSHLTDIYGCSREDAKRIIIAYLYGGGFNGRKKQGLIPDDATECDLLSNLRLEIKHIHKTLARHNPEVIAVTKRIKQGGKMTNVNGSACSYILQEYEARILEVVYIYCVDRGVIRNGIVSLCADGLMIEAERFYENLPAELGDVVLRATGFNLEFIEKPMKESYRDILCDHVITPLDKPVPAPSAIIQINKEIAGPDAKHTCAVEEVRPVAVREVQADVDAKAAELQKVTDEIKETKLQIEADKMMINAMNQSIQNNTKTISKKEAKIIALRKARVTILSESKAFKPKSEERKELQKKIDKNEIDMLTLKDDIRITTKQLREDETARSVLVKKIDTTETKLSKRELSCVELRQLYEKTTADADKNVDTLITALVAAKAKEGVGKLNHRTSPSHLVFAELVPDFEKEHCKIVNRAMFVKETQDGIVTFTRQQLSVAYSHIPCGLSPEGVPVAFIDKWTGINPDILRFDDMDIYPNVADCPKNIYNLWRPFAYESMPTDFIPNNEAYARFVAHISILVGHEENCVKRVLDWIAHSLLYPWMKSTCLVFISTGKGSGKSTLIHILSKIYGLLKVMETHDACRDVWGAFNGLMVNKFLVNLDELSRKDTLESSEKIKGLITGGNLAINEKGKPQYEVRSCHRFIVTTNNEEGGIQNDVKERRFDIFQSSNEKCAKTDENNKYFNQLYTDADDPAVIMTIVTELKKRIVQANFLNSTTVKSAYQRDLEQAARNPVDLWLEDYVNIFAPTTGAVDIPCSDLFREYKMWCEDHNYKYDSMTCQKFGIRMNNLFPAGAHTKYFTPKNIKINKIPVTGKTINVEALRGYYKSCQN